jgi:hypothetical protein
MGVGSQGRKKPPQMTRLPSDYVCNDQTQTMLPSAPSGTTGLRHGKSIWNPAHRPMFSPLHSSFFYLFFSRLLFHLATVVVSPYRSPPSSDTAHWGWGLLGPRHRPNRHRRRPSRHCRLPLPPPRSAAIRSCPNMKPLRATTTVWQTNLASI